MDNATRAAAEAGRGPTRKVQPSRTEPRNEFVRWTRGDIEQSIQERFGEQAAKFPDRLAVKGRGSALTYEALNRAANRLARAILSQRGEREEPVALFLEHAPCAMVGIMGVLKSGKFYVPLDPRSPRARVQYCLKDSQAGLIVASGKSMGALAAAVPDGLPVINIDEIDDGLPDGNPGLSAAPDAPAAILYTSGSTGKPKGVINTHRTLLHARMVSTNARHISKDDRAALLGSYGFSASMSAIFDSLLNGGAVFPFDVREEGLSGLAEWLAREEITILPAVPTVFRNFVGTLTGEEEFAKLRLVSLGGETVHRRDVELYKEHFPDDCLLTVSLGMTETCRSVARLFIDKTTEIEDDAVPAGYATDDVEILLWDERGNEVGFDRAGEIAVKGRYLSPGYWRRPDLTAQVFLDAPGEEGVRIYRTGDLGRMSPDGCLVHLGRKDFQVKVRGHRVETGEVEKALLGTPGIANAAVLALEDGHGDARLIAYVEADLDPRPTVSGLRAHIGERLPDYLVPSTFVFMDSLPVTVSGKVDRAALPEPDASRPELDAPFVPPRTPIEKRLARIWSEVLEISPVGIRDNFFDLGGHSLTAARLFSEIEKMSGRSLPLASLLEAPTVTELAGILETQGWSPPWSSVVPIQPRGSKKALFCIPGAAMDVVHFVPLARSLGPDQPLYGLQALGLDGPQAPHDTVEDMAAHYAKEICATQPKGPYFLAGRCFGGFVALETARQLRERGHEAPLVVLFDSSQPPPPISLRDYARCLVFHHLPRGQLVYCFRRDIRERARDLRLKLALRRGRRHILRVWKAHDHARLTYQPKPYAGRITLFQSEEFNIRFPYYQARWEALAGGGLDCHIIPGQHREMLKEPQLGMVTERLRACLSAAAASSESAPA